MLLHSALAIDPENGQPLALLWQKLWHRQRRPKAPKTETPAQKKKRQAKARRAVRKRSFEQKESYRWVEAQKNIAKSVGPATRIIHVFDREGDMAEEYHKVLKSGCQVARYRLAAEGMQTLLGFLCVTAVELLRLTHMERTQSQLPAQDILTPLQIEVLKAKTPKVPKVLTVAWALTAVARIGGYLEHRHKIPIGIQVLWKGWAKLKDLTEGWKLATQRT